MALFTEDQVRKRAQSEILAKSYRFAMESLTESARTYSSKKTYDIFLSHSIRDKELILGMKKIFEDIGYDVYVDWIDDPQLDRSNVSPATAEKLRQRMSSCKSLFFVTTENSDSSKWMPWECGFFDGKKEKVAIVPIKKSSFDNSYYGQEYLGLYPYVIESELSNKPGKDLFIFKNSKSYVYYPIWLKTPNAQLNWKSM
jgi:hypothetical protein